MKGYVCDRCQAIGQPRVDAHDHDESPPEGWVSMQANRLRSWDLCAKCSRDYELAFLASPTNEHGNVIDYGPQFGEEPPDPDDWLQP